jgi:3-deoxy-D-manno-octulosonic-acid transferase
VRSLSGGLWAGATTLAAPALRLLLRRRLARGKELADRLAERRGLDATPRPPGRLLWVHAASVGETVSVLPVLAALPARVAVLLTTGSVTSARLLARRLPELGLQDRVMHRFVPLDVPRWAARFLAHWRPDAAAFLESELWPNLIAGCAARRIPLLLLNARMSPRSHAGWRRARGLARQMLGGFTDVLAQSPQDAARLADLGAAGVSVSGNLKFAAAPLPADPAELAKLQAAVAGRPVWLAANTHPGEEAIAAAIHHALAPSHPGLLTIIAPRHPERGAAIAAGLDAPRRSAGAGPDGAGIWVADTLGDLGLLYRLAPIVFVGRSLAVGGGQNPLEAARLGCAIAMGPLTDSQQEAVTALAEAGALTRVADAAALQSWVDAMLRDPAARQRAAQAGQAVLGRHAELPARIAALLVERLGA